MNRLIAHRGPDDDQAWVHDDAIVGLGHRRLAIVDLSDSGRQPMRSHDRRWTIVYNGELYNTDDLRRQLGPRAAPYRGHSDTEVLVECIAAWGVEDAVPRLNGMFAFAVWDGERNELWLARDRFGEKPLYYTTSPGELLFSSELRPIVESPGFGSAISTEAVADLVATYAIGAPRTIYDDVAKLEPGTLLRFRADGNAPTEHRYWRPEQVAAEQRAAYHDPDDAADQLDSLLRSVVRSRLVSDVPLGAFLSGGIDSSLVVAMMSAAGPTPTTFTVGFPDEGYDESPHARKIAEHLATDHHELMVSGSEARAVVPRLSRIYDEPFADSSQIPTFIVSEFAARHVKVALSGDGGDELFGGYERYRYFERLQRMQRMHPSVRRGLAALSGALPDRAIDRLGATRLGRMLPQPLRRRPGHRLNRLSRLLAASDAWNRYEALVTVDLDPAHVVLGAQRVPSRRRASLAGLDATQTGMLHDTLHYLPSDILTKVDRASMAVSLETRVPLLDPDLFEFAWQLDPSLRVRDGVGKWLLTEVLCRHVPRTLVERPKQGFGVPMGSWLRGPLRAWGDELLDASVLRADGYFDAVEVRRRWDAHQSGTVDLQAQIWPILMFQSWLHDGRS